MVPSCLPGASQAVQMVISCLVPPWCLPGCPISPFLLPWCLAGCPIGLFLPPWCLAGCPLYPFLPPWCFPGASQAVQLVLSCLLVSSRSFPASLVPSWCLPGVSLVPRRPVLLSRCLPGASQAVQNGSFLPSQAVQLVLSCLPGASLVPRRPSNWSESRFWTGAGFCLNFSATSMANGPVRGKSWGGPHGRLPVAQAGL